MIYNYLYIFLKQSFECKLILNAPTNIHTKYFMIKKIKIYIPSV
jgi:hypothetical protein